MKQIGVLIISLIVLASATGAILASIQQGNGRQVFTLVTDNMVFNLQASDLLSAANPTITVKRGQKVTIILRNEEAGMRHDFVIEELDIHLKEVAFGETTQLTFTVPNKPGQYVYFCSRHRQRMRGSFIVE